MNWKKQEVSVGLFTGKEYGMLIVLLMIVLMSVSLMGCTSPSHVKVLDSRLTAPIERPVLQGDTNRDVWRLAIEQAEVIDECAERINAIRELSR